uniref:LisH domain-containing protein n=1 Tax=Macrostomum lignano TaxID=282301 RepID=A0A1I8GR74_9PLAT
MQQAQQQNAGSTSSSVARTATLIEAWHRSRDQAGYNPVPTLLEICSLLEQETENYFHLDPDPFDERSPAKANPNSTLAAMYKVLFRWDEVFVRYLYILMDKPNCENVKELTIVAMRFLITAMQSIDTFHAFTENEEVIDYLYLLADNAPLPASCYAANLLGFALDSSDIVFRYRAHNTRLIPVLLRRLIALKDEMLSVNAQHFTSRIAASLQLIDGDCSNSSTRDVLAGSIGTYSLHPLTIEMQQRLYLTYLVPMAEYQEVLAPMLECQAVQLIFDYIDPGLTKDIRLTFNALRLLCAMLCHKKFSVEFLLQGGVQRLLRVRRPSVSSTAVSVAFYYLAYFEDSMERLCSLPEDLVANLVEYGLWLLECSHNTGRCYATMFFSHAFGFKLILDYFDKQDGLRKLYNVMATQVIFTGTDDEVALLPEDALFTCRQIVKLVTGALRRYFELHLLYKSESLSQEQQQSHQALMLQHPPSLSLMEHGPQRTLKYTAEQVSEACTVLLHLAQPDLTWLPVDSLDRLNGLNFLLRLVALSAFEWGPHSGRPETIQHSLAVVLVCCCVAKQMRQMLVKFSITADYKADGIQLLLTLADNEEFLDPEVQKLSLAILNLCVSRPLDSELMQQQHQPLQHHRDEASDFVAANILETPSSNQQQPSVTKLTGSAVKRRADRQPITAVVCTPQQQQQQFTKEQYVQQVWRAVRSCNGIMSLLRLLETRTPLTDADCIRALACRCLLGLSRDDKISQMLAKLQLFSKGHLQLLMKEPVLPDKLRDHAKFVRSASKLIERVSGGQAHKQINGIGVNSSDTGAGSVNHGANGSAGLSGPTANHSVLGSGGLANVGIGGGVVSGVVEGVGSGATNGVVSGGSGVSMEWLRRAEIVANTRITWDGKELLHLMYNHLLSKGLSESAAVLQREAGLRVAGDKPAAIATNIYHSAGMVPPTPSTPASSAAVAKQQQQQKQQLLASSAASTLTNNEKSDLSSSMSTLGGQTLLMSPNNNFNSIDSASPSLPLKVNIVRNSCVRTGVQAVCSMPQQQPAQQPQQPQPLSLQQTTSLGRDRPSQYNLYLQPSKPSQPVGEQQSLERIISEYLLQQHAQCPNPVSTCPAFSLLEPHRCSAPRTRSHAMRPANAAQRMRTKSYGQWRANPRDIGRENRRYLYSRFKPVRTFRDPEEDSPYSCCRLLTKRGRLLIGSAGGRVKCVDHINGQELCCWTTNNNATPPSCINVNQSETLMAVCATWGNPASRLFAYPNESVSVEEYDIERFHVMDFEDEAFVEFDPCSLSRVLTTKNNAACIYDVESKTRIAALYDQESSNDYLRNRAVFNADGNLVLNDGVLWDVRDSTRSVHKFDKFQNLISGVFHPNCLEIIISSEVWDLRSFRLLNTVPSLEQMEIQFTACGDAIFGASFLWDDDELRMPDQLNSSLWTIFRTLDARDYSLIASVDLKRRIRSISIDANTDYMAVCECTATDDVLNEEQSLVRLYQIGKRKEDEEERGVDEDTEDENDQAMPNDETMDDDDDDDEDDDNDDDDDGEVNARDLAHMLELAGEIADLEEEAGDTSDASEASDDDNEDDEEEDDDDFEIEDDDGDDADDDDDDEDDDAPDGEAPAAEGGGAAGRRRAPSGSSSSSGSSSAAPPPARRPRRTL